MKKTVMATAGIALASLLALGGMSCSKKDGGAAPSGAAKSSGKAVTIKYELWDSAQLPAYQAVAKAFHEKNPNITVEIAQLGWDDYWTGLQTEMIGGSASDVFTDHLAKYLDFASKNQLVDLAPYIKRDNVDTSIYMNGLEKLWQTKDGKTYGLPKDWDTICIVYNKDLTDKYGVSHDELNNLTWNPSDGGSFEKMIRKLSIDANGRNGLDAKFDKNNVAQYGLVLSHSDDRGQAQFSGLACSTGWMYTDGLYDSNYHYDDPRFINTIKWMKKMQDEGIMAPYTETSNGSASIFNSQKAALVFDGSWMIGSYKTNGVFEVGFARLPEGSAGRKSMINGLGDSIWVGSKHKEEAWQWVKFLASREAQEIVGSYGVVFPAIQSGVDKALATYKTKGYDVTAFTDEAVAPNCTFLYPILDHSVEIGQIMTRTFDQIFLGQKEVEPALKDSNAQIKALFK